MKQLALTMLLTMALGATTANAQQNDGQLMQMTPDHMRKHMHDMSTQAQNETMQEVVGVSAPTQAGQSAFAAIQEIVEILMADPKTDWGNVNIEALRQHLIDMNNVTLYSNVAAKDVDGGVQFTITGDAVVAASIKRMVTAHSMTMNGTGGWTFEPREIPNGAELIVKAPDQDLTKLKALGFIGILTAGMHHQLHHLAIARGEHPHS